MHVAVGRADADTALALSGYGVDPGRFSVLQRLLPTYPNETFPFGEDTPRWRKMEYGHKENWTEQNAEFAYRETINLLTRLQNANPYPTPYLYDDVFSNVLVVKKDSPEVTWMYLGIDGWFIREYYGPPFAIGDRIECRARGTNSPLVSDPNECTQDPDTSKFVVAMGAVSDKVISDGPRPTLIFASQDVEIIDVPLDDL